MMNTTKITAGLGVLALGGLALTACSSGSSESTVADDCVAVHPDITTVSDGALTVGVTDTPPYSANETGGGATGLDIDIARKIAEMECLEVKFVEATYANSIPMITQQRSIDITTGAWYPTAERNKVVDFAGPMYYDSMSIASKGDLSTVADLESADAVGTVDGYLWTEDLKSLLGDKLRTYPSTVELQQDLINGRLTASVDSSSVQLTTLATQGYTVNIAEPDDRVVASVQPAQAVFPLSKDATDLREAITADLLTIREDGTMAEILVDNKLDEELMVPVDEELRIIG